jgi:AcrR family transcriptional regulator
MQGKKRLGILDQIVAKDKVRQKIIDAASELYAKKGFKATSIEEIAEKAGVTVPVTYQYIKNKSEIMRLIMEDMLNIFKENLISQLKDIEEPEKRLSIAISLYFRMLDQQQDKVLLMYQKSSSLDKASKSKIMDMEVELSRIFGNIIEDGIKKGVFRNVDVDVASYNIIILAHMWSLKRWHFRKRLSIDDYVNMQMEFIMNALKK